jgi:pimeloyl-ACP methyl ester carboxylesterase
MSLAAVRGLEDMTTPATYVLLPGAGGDAWYWHLVAPLLEARGHDVVAVDLPCGDDCAGLAEYADTVVSAVGDRSGLALVAQSMAAFTAPMVCERVDVGSLISAPPPPRRSPGGSRDGPPPSTSSSRPPSPPEPPTPAWCARSR